MASDRPSSTTRLASATVGQLSSAQLPKKNPLSFQREGLKKRLYLKRIEQM
jgi:hypothetical protein